jgi:hypothetical protein
VPFCIVCLLSKSDVVDTRPHALRTTPQFGFWKDP